MKSIRKTKSHKHQKLWKMFGCSKKFTHKRNIKGGSCPNADVNLAYTGTPTNCSIVQPQLAYTGKGGKRRRRGSCGGATCAMHGGGTDGVPFPLPGNSWTYKNWPGFTNDVDATQYSLNQYPNPQADRILIQERDIYIPDIKGGKRRRSKKQSKKQSRQYKKHYSRKMRGGRGSGVSNILSQMGSDLSNTTNVFSGKPMGPSPMPYLSQYYPVDDMKYLESL